MSSKYRPDIDGLRAIAVGAVVAFHAFPQYLPGGFVGVDIFFVISGFLITSILLNEVATGTYSLRQFYLRRIRRVLPALAIVLIATITIGWHVLLPGEFIALGEHATAAVLFASNLALWRESGYFDAAAATKPLLHLWSLGIEEQFYIVWPLLIAGLARWKWFRLALLVAITYGSYRLSEHLVAVDVTAAFYSPLSRTWELAAGGLVAMLLASVNQVKVPWVIGDLLTIAGLYGLWVSISTMTEAMPFPGQGALLPVAASAAIMLSGGRGLVGRYVLGNRAFVAVGLISYPLYLWHWPLMAYANVMLIDGPTPSIMAGIVAASVVLATATYLLVERNVRKLPRWRSASPIIALPAMGLIGVFGVSIFLLNGIPARYPAEIRNVLAIGNYQLPKEARFPECWVGPDIPVASISKACDFANNGKTKILVWGDSHAATFYSGLKKLTGDAYDVAQYTRSACPPLIGFPGFCGESNREVIEKIRQTKPDVVIVDGAWANYGDFIYQFNQSDDFRATLAALKATGTRKIVALGPTPFWTPFLPTIVYREWSVSREIPNKVNFGMTDLVVKWDEDVRVASEAAGIEYYSVAKRFCDDEGCSTHTEKAKDDLIAWDNSHLTMSAASVVAGALQDRGIFEIPAPKDSVASHEEVHLESVAN